jgi:acyl-CoA dehydrogenase
MRERVLPRFMSGELTLCFALSEPGAGSDAAMIKTKANKDGDGWRISGSKIWTTNSPHADYVIVFAVTDHEKASRRQGGISTFFIPTTAPGFSVQRVIKMWGSIGGDEAVLIFDGVRAEPHQLVGDLDDGFATAMLGTDLGRLYNTARSVGLARWCLEMGFEYIKQRKTFGRAISEYQGVTFPLAESAMEIHAAHLMGLNVAQLIDKGMNVRKELAMAKSFASRKATKAADRVMQVHGAMGMTNELFLTDAYTALRKINIADGTNEILAHIVVKETLRGKTEL